MHERDKDADFALLIVRKLLRTVSPDTKVILMSATFNTEQFAKYFAQPVRGTLDPAPIVTIKGRKYDVTEYYLEDLKSLTKEVGLNLPVSCEGVLIDKI